MKMTRSAFCLLPLLVIGLGASVTEAQESQIGAGKVEIGGIPVGGTFFVGGDDDEEVDFNVYTLGGSLTYYLTSRAAIEGELTTGLGMAQDVMFHNAQVFHVQMPTVWSYFGNVVFFPGGATGKRLPFYVTGGIGAVTLQSREPTGQFGYDEDTVGSETFIAENIGGGVKIFRAAVPDWGFRAEYRYLIINSKDDAPAFFAKAKTRGGHRIAFGVLYTWKR
jgi:opacity protein-like surface antigen